MCTRRQKRRFQIPRFREIESRLLLETMTPENPGLQDRDRRCLLLSISTHERAVLIHGL